MRSTNLLGKIEEQAIDGDISKALRLCLSLGGKTGSTDLSGWASLELNGYRGQDVPEYRRIVAPLQVDGMTMSHHVKGQTISTYDLPDFVVWRRVRHPQLERQGCEVRESRLPETVRTTVRTVASDLTVPCS